MSTSEFGHYVRHTESALDSLDPLDTGMMRRGAGNVNHLSDQFAQRRIGWSSDPFETVADEPVPGEWYRVWTSHPFDLHVMPNGESYRCRVRLRISSGSASDKATFRAVISPRGAGLAELYRGDVNVYEAIVTQTAYTWEQAGDLLYLDAPLVARVTDDVATIDAIGGATATARWIRPQLSVWVDVADGAVVAGLGGVELDEYMEP
jgi:hypothetical protein